jgi:hypothetical protein
MEDGVDDVPQAGEPLALAYLKWAAAAVTALTIIVGGIYGGVHWLFDRTDGGQGTTVAEQGKVQTVQFTPHGTAGTVLARARVTGQKGGEVRLLWTLMDAELSRPVREKGFEDQVLAQFKPDSDDFSREYSATVPAPTTTDLVFLRVRLLDRSGQQLDFSDSDMFRIGGVPGS